jgi:hypothetical protein
MRRKSGRFAPINVISPKRVILNKALQPSSSRLKPRHDRRSWLDVGPICSGISRS